MGLYVCVRACNKSSCESSYAFHSQHNPLSSIGVRFALGLLHSGQDFVHPLQRTMEVDLNPAGRAGHHLSPVVDAPALDKAHPNGAHASKAVDSLKPAVHRLSQPLCKVLVVENVHVTSGGNLANCGRVPVAAHVAVWRLHKDAAFAEILCEYLAADVHEPHPTPYVTAGHLNGGITVDVGKQSQTESLRGVGICEPIYD